MCDDQVPVLKRKEETKGGRKEGRKEGNDEGRMKGNFSLM
jgi:hypothetical protein